MLDEDNTQTQQQLADQLNVARESISRRLRAMGKIHKIGKWVPHELNERQQENRKTTCEMLLARYKKKSFLHRVVTGDEKWIYFENPKRKGSWVTQLQVSHRHRHRLQSQIAMDGRQCSALCLVGSKGCGLLRASKTWRNCQY